MKNLSHPGSLVDESIKAMIEIQPGITQETIAIALGVSRKTLNKLVNCNQSISTEMAIRLSVVFSNTTPEFWLKTQMNYDLSVIDRDYIINSTTRLW